MPVLDVPGACLSYETRGAGPLFLLIPGGVGTGDPYYPLASVLAAKYTIVTYDRRGFSRSELKGEQDYSVRLRTDVDDAQAVIKHLSSDGKAIVFGTSSGAIIALSLLLTYPESIKLLLSHEPPACDLLPDGAEWVAFKHRCYDIWKAEGPRAALTVFMDRISGGRELEMFRKQMAATAAEVPDSTTPAAKNQAYWFEHELRQYPPTKFDVEELRKQKDKLVLLGGKESEGLHPILATKVLSEKLDLPILEMPGGHMAFTYETEEFAKGMMEELEKRGE